MTYFDRLYATLYQHPAIATTHQSTDELPCALDCLALEIGIPRLALHFDYSNHRGSSIVNAGLFVAYGVTVEELSGLVYINDQIAPMLDYPIRSVLLAYCSYGEGRACFEWVSIGEVAIDFVGKLASLGSLMAAPPAPSRAPVMRVPPELLRLQLKPPASRTPVIAA